MHWTEKEKSLILTKVNMIERKITFQKRFHPENFYLIELENELELWQMINRKVNAPPNIQSP